MIRAIIVDDEDKALKSIQMIVENHCTGVEVAGTAQSVSEAMILIESEKPDVVFLDIEMPEANGFDLLERVEDRNFEVIFITAYNHHAIKAIKYSAFDYILKPVDIDELQDAVENVKSKVKSKDNIDSQFDILLENIHAKNPKKLAIPISDGIEFLDIENIIRLEADRSYTTFFLSNNKRVMVSKSMKEYSILEQDSFFRVHRSHLINLKYMRKYMKKDGGYIEMSDGSQVPISRQKKGEFLEVMKKITH